MKAIDTLPDRVLTNSTHIAALLFWALVIAHTGFGIMQRQKYTILFIGAAVLFYIFEELVDAFSDGDTLDIRLLSVVGAITIITVGYMFLNFRTLFFQQLGFVLWYQYFIAIPLLLAVFYCAYRAFNTAFVAVGVGAIAYGYLGPLIPGLFGHSGLGTERMLGLLVLEVQGIFGSISAIVGVWVSLFLLYAGLLRGYGAFDLIMRAAFKTATFVRSGVAQAAVVSSMLVGSINGAQTANVAMTGSITIPTMKESGLRSDTAGGIESVASSGGQIMPPVMGAAAFVMASLLGIRYLDVLIAGILPALIFFVTVAIAVHYTAVDQLSMDYEAELDDFVDSEADRTHLVAESVKFLIPFAILIYLLGIVQFTVMTSALYTCIAMVIMGIIVPILEEGYRAMRNDSERNDLTTTITESFYDTIRGATFGASALAPIVIIIAIVNGVVDLLVATGVPGMFSLAIINLSGGSILLAGVLAMVGCIILGMGMPTVAAYTIVALLIAPGLVDSFAIPELAAHFFVFYAAMLSGITPPIAIAVVIATGIAESNFWRTSFEALKIAAVLFILPFVFLTKPMLVTEGITPGTLLTFLFTLGGGFGLIHGINYNSHVSRSRWIDLGVRGIYIICGIITMLVPVLAVEIAGLGIIVVLSSVQLTSITDGLLQRTQTEDV